MKKLLPFILLLFFVTAQAQEQITLKFVRPNTAQGSDQKIQISVQNNDYLIKNGGTISVNVTPDYGTSLKIDCSAPSGVQTSYFLDPKQGQSYEFEVGLKMNGIYIKLTSGEEAGQAAILKPADTDKDKGQWATKVNVDRKDLSVGISAEKTNETSSIREEWLKKGGKVHYSSALLNGLYIRMDMKGSGTINGYGGGYSVATNWINLKMPEFKPGLSKWNTINYGGGMDINIYGMSYKMSGSDVSALVLNIMLVGNVGWTWGLGKFLDEANWKGVALTLKYRPTFNVSSTSSTVKVYGKTITSSSSSSSFNAGGFGFDIDFSNYTATLDKIAPKPRSKVSFFFLPPVGDSPLFISLSVGVTIYAKKREPGQSRSMFKMR